MRALLRLRDEGKLDSTQMYWFRQTKKPEELYDIIHDPYELNNLADNPEYLDKLIRLRGVHENWVKRIGDNITMTEKELVWEMWPGGVQPITEDPVISESNDSIIISCSTEGASIAYQINGKGFKEGHWFLYTKPFVIGEGDVVSARAIRIGFKESGEVFWEEKEM